MSNSKQDANKVTDKYEDLYRDGNTIIEFVSEQIIYHNYTVAKSENDKELMTRIEKNWDEIFGVPFFESEAIPVGVLGGPGQGKTSVMKAAAQRAAQIMGLNFINDKNIMPTKNDFFFDSVTLGGSLSPSLLKGHYMPATQTFIDHNGNEVIEKVMSATLPDNVLKAKYARASFILLDDAPNAHPDLLTAAYDLLKPETNSEFSKIYYSFTGNTGDDGAAAKKFNTALASRCRLLYMCDTVMDFINRIENQYNGDIAQTYINSLALGLLEADDSLLNTPPITAQRDKTQFACSRTWTQFISQMAQSLRPFAYKENKDPSSMTDEQRMMLIGKLRDLSVDNLGRDVGAKFYSHALRVIQDADPIARDILTAGAVTSEITARLERQYSTGETPSDNDFMYALADSLSSRAATMYVNAVNAKDTTTMALALKGFSEGAFSAIKSPKTPQYVQHCYQRFFSAVASRSDFNPLIGFKNPKGVLTLNNAFFNEVITAASKNVLAVTQYEALGSKTTLLDQIRGISSVRALDATELNRSLQEKEAYDASIEKFKNQANSNASNAAVSSPISQQATTPAATAPAATATATPTIKPLTPSPAPATTAAPINRRMF